jgi:hypothetical protein
MFKNLYIKVDFWVLGCCFLLLFSCAKQGSPTGGKKDTHPPVIVETEPESGSVNFDQDYFDIQFNEFIQLNNIQQNLIVSPPFSEKPEVKIRGKGVRVVLPEKPQPNTTYSFTFLDAISDITERNTIQSLVYAFSTGDEIDSLKVSGHVKDAFTDEPVSDIFVMLYSNPADSMFRKHIPDYLTKTDKQGAFSFFYLARDDYKIYALDDANYSGTFDQPNEKIAFLDSLITPEVQPEKDSTDSITGFQYLPADIELRLFEQAQYLQFVDEAKRPESNHLKVFFKRPQDSVINWYSPDFDTTQVLTDFSENKDSLEFWFTDTSICIIDSVQLMIDYYSGVDSLGWEKDTLVLSAESSFYNEKLELTTNLDGGKLNYWELPEITLNSVTDKISEDRMRLLHHVNDSVKDTLDFDIHHAKNRRFEVVTEFREGGKYELTIDSLAVRDMLHRYNDSVTYEFSVNEKEDFSTLIITIPGTGRGWFCDLLQKDKIVKRIVPDDNSTIEISHLVSGQYMLRLVEDMNNNKQWDTGDFDKKLQPERVWYKTDKIELRSNWTQEIQWHVFEEHHEEKENE